MKNEQILTILLLLINLAKESFVTYIVVFTIQLILANKSSRVVKYKFNKLTCSISFSLVSYQTNTLHNSYMPSSTSCMYEQKPLFKWLAIEIVGYACGGC